MTTVSTPIELDDALDKQITDTAYRKGLNKNALIRDLLSRSFGYLIPWQVKYVPSILFPLGAIISVSSLFFSGYPLSHTILGMISLADPYSTLCKSTLPDFLACLFIFMVVYFIWILIAWLAVHSKHFAPLEKEAFSLENMARMHYLQSELWFSIIMFILTFCISFALSNFFFIKCDSSVRDFLKELSSLTPRVDTWIVIFEHAIPLISLNGFAFTSVLLGFLWARQNYRAHSHNNIIFEHKATYWNMIDALPGDSEKRADRLYALMQVPLASGYEENAQPIQLTGVGISAPPGAGISATRGST